MADLNDSQVVVEAETAENAAAIDTNDQLPVEAENNSTNTESENAAPEESPDTTQKEQPQSDTNPVTVTETERDAVNTVGERSSVAQDIVDPHLQSMEKTLETFTAHPNHFEADDTHSQAGSEDYETLSPHITDTFEPPQETLEDRYEFSQIQFSEDRVHPLPQTARAIVSPPAMDYHGEGFTFVNANYEADPDELILGLTTAMSRSGSMDSLTEDVTASRQVLIQQQEEGAILDKNQIILLRPASPTTFLSSSAPHDGQETEGVSNESGYVDADGEENQLSTQQDTEHDAEADEKQETLIPPEPEIDRDALVVSIRQLLETRERHTQRSLFLQHRLGEFFKKKRTDDVRDSEKTVSDQDQRYANCMMTLNELRAQYDEVNATNQKVVEEYQTKLEDRKGDVGAQTDEFAKYKRSIALAAENSRTGNSIPSKVIEQLEALERKKESEVAAVRLENIKLRNKLRRHEQLLRQKEELADGLHLIDFEQLKIENQTYNEKIEERNEELLKLRKKITNVVQVLTHVKEKLQFVQNEAVSLKEELKSLDEEVTNRRDSLPIAKQQRDALRNANTTLRQEHGLLGNNRLLRDYGEKVDESKSLRGRIEELKREYSTLVNETVRIRRKMQKAQLVAQLTMENASPSQIYPPQMSF